MDLFKEIRVNLDDFRGLAVINYTAAGLPVRLFQAFFNFFFGGFGFPGILIISLGDIAFFFTIIIGHSQDLLRVISGFPGEKGSRYFIIPFNITVSLGIIFR